MYRFATVGDLLSGYTIVHDLDEDKTSVWCNRCDEWVYEDEETTTLSAMDLYESVIEGHTEPTVTFK